MDMESMNKTVFNSKKFAAFIVSISIIASVLIVALVYKPELNAWTAGFMMIGLLGLCSVSIGYILGQASLDKFLSKIGEVVKDVEPKSHLE